jgi:hypothetical protein
MREKKMIFFKKYKEFLKENIDDIDPYGEEQWDDNVVFDKNDVKILIENGFEIYPYQYDDEEWDEEQSAVKHIQIGKDLCRVEITKVNSNPIRYFLHVNSLEHAINYNDYELEKSLYNLSKIIDRQDFWYMELN